MKLITIFILVTISIIIQARTRGEAKSGISSFINSKTHSSSKSDDDDDKSDKNDKSDKSDKNDKSDKSDIGDISNIDIPVRVVWYWQNMFTPKGKDIQKEGKLVYIASSYTYQSWTPTGINNAKTETTDLSIAKLELSLFFNSIYFSYETSFYGANLEKQRKLLEIRDKEKHGWEKFLTEVKLPFTIMIGKYPIGKIYFGYDKQVFISTVTSLIDKMYYTPRSESGKSDNENLLEISKGDKIVTTTLFKDYYFGLKMDSHPNIKYSLGIFILTYNKPYSITVDGQQDEKHREIYDTDFSAGGLYINLTLDYSIFHIKTGFKFGAGDVHLVGLDAHLDDLIGNDLTTQYFQFDTELGLHHDITKNIKLESYIRTEYRDFYLNKEDSTPNDNIDDSANFDLNNDFIFTVYAGISYSF